MRHKAKAAATPCRVYWSTHACRKQRGHLGNHLCTPGCPHPDGYELTGEDALTYPNGPTPADIIEDLLP